MIFFINQIQVILISIPIQFLKLQILLEQYTITNVIIQQMIQNQKAESKKSVYVNKNKFNYDSVPNFPIQINKELKIVSMEISEHGKSGGVIFIETQNGSLVLKTNNEAPQDFFFNQFALSLDINVPVMTTIACYEPDFEHLVFLIEQYCHKDEVLYARLKTKLDFPFYQLMEYIPSISLAHIGQAKFTKNMLTDYKMYSLGMCLAFDMIINNNDRFSLVWRGEGNINNILIEVPQHKRGNLQKAKDREDDSVLLGNFAYIDHDGHMIDNSDPIARGNIEKYMNIITQFQLNMIQFLRKQHSSNAPQIDKLIKQISFFTRYHLNDHDIVRICEGIIYCTKKFIDLYENNQIKNLHEAMIKPTDTKTKVVNYWNQYWNRQFKKVNINFCELFYVKVSAIYTTYPELINQIYNRVKKIVDLNKNSRRRRVSTNSRKNSQMSQNQQNLDENSENKSQSKEENKQQQNMQEQKDKGDKKRWRQKLQVFKQENYK